MSWYKEEGARNRFWCAILALLLVALLTVGVAMPAVLASDVSSADYLTTVAVSNNSSAPASNVFVPFTLSTQEMIDNNMLAANASDCAMRTASGTDVAFMPSANSSYPWMTYVSSIGGYSQVNQYLYSDGATGGKIRYFPGPSGNMTTSDHSSIEPGDNFTYKASGWFDATVSGNITSKEDAFVIEGDGSGSITASILNIWTNPTGNVANGWTNPASAYDDDTGTYALYTVSATSWSPFLELSYSAGLVADGGRYYIGGSSSITQVDFDLYYDGDWQDIYEGALTLDVWTTRTIPGGQQTVTSARIRCYNNAGTSQQAHIKEYDYGSHLDISATGVSSGEHIIEVTADGSLFLIYIDSVESDNTSLGGASVPDNDNDWVSFTEGIMDYVHYQEIRVGGEQRQYVDWEYGTVFHDSSGYDNDATPTFRTTSSDADVSAEVTAQGPVGTQGSPTTATPGGWTMVESVPGEPPGLYTEGGTDFPGGAELQDWADDSRLPVEVLTFPIAIGTSLGAGLLAYMATHKLKVGTKGSLLVMFVVTLVVWIYWTLTGDGVIPGWTIAAFAVPAVLILLWRRPYDTPIG